MIKLGRNEAILQLNNVMFSEKVLPDFVFRRKFDGYRLFDGDISANDKFIAEFQTIIKNCYGARATCRAFSASSLEYLSDLDMDQNWAVEIPVLSRVLRSERDCGGVILLADTGKWIAVQQQPIDIGVFAFSLASDAGRLMLKDADCFFNCDNIEEWLAGSSDRDKALCESLGVEWLTGFLKNYCDKLKMVESNEN